MRILVCMKAIPREIVRVKVSEDGGRVLYESLGQTANESDEYALERALTLKTTLKCEVVVASVGSLKCQDVVYLGLAKGADQGIRIDADTNDPETISMVIARAVTKLECDLVLTGVESWDNLTAQVGTLTAAKLGFPTAYAVTNVEMSDEPETVRVTKELGGGVSQLMDIRLPALLCIQSGAQPLSYAPAAKIIQARRNPLRVLKLGDLGVDKAAVTGGGQFKIIDIRVPERKKLAQFLEGNAKEVASELVARVRDATA